MMALQHIVAVLLLFTISLNEFKLSTCQDIKGMVSCPSCTNHYDLSGIEVMVKCDQVKKVASAITNKDGYFEAQLPSNSDTNVKNVPASRACLAMLVGGPRKLYAMRTDSVSQIIKSQDSNSRTMSTPLVVSAACPPGKETICAKHSNVDDIGSYKTVDLPNPREWGFPPLSNYVPFIPIIGIP